MSMSGSSISKKSLRGNNMSTKSISSSKSRSTVGGRMHGSSASARSYCSVSKPSSGGQRNQLPSSNVHTQSRNHGSGDATPYSSRPCSEKCFSNDTRSPSYEGRAQNTHSEPGKEIDYDEMGNHEMSSCHAFDDGCSNPARKNAHCNNESGNCCTPDYDSQGIGNYGCSNDSRCDCGCLGDEVASSGSKNGSRYDGMDRTDGGAYTGCLSPVPSVIESCTSLSSVRSFPSFDADPEQSVDSIKSSLSRHVSRRYKDIVKACRNFDRKSTGKLTKSQLRQVVRTFCMPLTAAQYRKLTENLAKDEIGKVNYVDFFSGLSQKAQDASDDDDDDESSSGRPELSLEEITVEIHRLIAPQLHDVIRAFWLFDFNKDGHVRRTELRKVLENYCFKLSDRQFRDLWSRYEKKDTGLIEYTDFLKKLGTHVERIKSQFPKLAREKTLLWEEPCQKLESKLPNYKSSRFQAVQCKSDDPSIQGLLENDVEEFLRWKLSVCGELIEKVLHLADYKNEGQVTVEALHDVLNCFAMPMSASLFKTVLLRLGVDVKPISHSVDIKDFVDKFCQPDPAARKSEAKKSLKASSCSKVVDRIVNTVLSARQAIENELVNLSKDRDDVITRKEMKRLIVKVLKYPLTDEEYKELTSFLDPRHENSINCGHFVSLFETDNTPSNRKMDWCFCPRSSDLGLASEDLAQRYQYLQGEKLLSKMKYYINKNRKTVEHALMVCDPNRCKLIRPQQMKMILHDFCFPLTDDQFNSLVPLFEAHGDRFDYVQFMKIFEKNFDEDSAKWRAMVDKLAHYRTSKSTEVTPEEVEDILSDAIRTKREGIEKDLRTLDPCKLGFAYKNDVKAVLSKYVMRMTDAQFEHLWNKFPVNENNCLLYEKLLEDFQKKKSSTQRSRKPESDESRQDGQQPEQGSALSCKSDFKPPKNPEEVLMERKQKLEEASKARVDNRVVPDKDQCQSPKGNKGVQDAAFTEFPHLRKTYESIRRPIIKNLAMLRQHFRRLDKKRTGRLHFTVIKNLLSKYKVTLTDEDAYYIQEFFDTDLTGEINYHDFMKLFAWYA